MIFLNKLDLKSMNLDELENIFSSIGEKKYRAKQLFKFIHQENGREIDDISVFSKDLREKLSNFTYINNLSILEKYSSKIDKTKKYIFETHDGKIVESVFLSSKVNNTICISTQVGCRMGCNFCASSKNGLERNLTTGEILDQIYTIEEDLDIKVQNIVLMGMGEPLDNLNNVMKFLSIINDEQGHNIGIRNITLSTCGIPDGIRKIADSGMQVNLAVSIHNPFQEEREKIMPVAKAYNLNQLKEALVYYQDKLNRRISYEYILIKDENDSFEHARELKNLCSGLDVHVNLIPLNNVKEYAGKGVDQREAKVFLEKLENLNINATIRRRQGADINAACGQLRNKFLG